jgi:hypothetical protein
VNAVEEICVNRILEYVINVVMYFVVAPAVFANFKEKERCMDFRVTMNIDVER